MLQFNTFYHIYNHANGDDNLFREQKNYAFFLEKYHRHIDPIADTIAWCLMPNHFHLLVKIKNEAEVAVNLPQPFLKFQTLEKVDEAIEEAKRKFLSKQFSNFFSSYSQAFNKVYNRRGSLFIKNFKRKEILSDDYLHTLILYIHLNPVKHGFTKLIGDWEWLSYHRFQQEHPELITKLFGNVEDFRESHVKKQHLFKEYNDLETELTI